jgi:rubrerythrin
MRGGDGGGIVKHWTLDDIPWERFDRSRVDPEILRLVKAAAMVEYNGGDYATYLCRVFHDDPGFQQEAVEWAIEEVQHGEALGRWAELADPTFNLKTAFARFTDGFKIDTEVETSIRGSRTGELVARCIVETGTSSYYTALMEAVDEPVLKEICRNIAADELRHYKLFYSHLRRYLEREKVSRLRRAMVALWRAGETEDGELAYAYYAANGGNEPYDRRQNNRAYARRAYGVYRPRHIQRGVAMLLKAAGFEPYGRINRVVAPLAWRFLRTRYQLLDRAGV